MNLILLFGGCIYISEQHFSLQAGLVTTLNTRTIVFGATNPKGHYDPDLCNILRTSFSFYEPLQLNTLSL